MQMLGLTLDISMSNIHDHEVPSTVTMLSTCCQRFVFPYACHTGHGWLTPVYLNDTSCHTGFRTKRAMHAMMHETPTQSSGQRCMARNWYCILAWLQPIMTLMMIIRCQYTTCNLQCSSTCENPTTSMPKLDFAGN